MDQLIKKAEILIESLPYIKTFFSKTFVIKYGGAAMTNEALKKDIINIVQMVLVGLINQEIVSLLNHYGGNAIGLSGKDANLIIARKHLPVMQYDAKDKKEKPIDLGYVGEIDKIQPSVLINLCEKGYIPVISPIGVGLDGESYNINADVVAGEIAKSLQAEKLIMLTDVDGIYEVPGNKATKIHSLTVNKAQEMINNNQIKSGMIPKVKACMEATTNGVKRTHIIDGGEKHSMLLEIFTDKGIGTMVTKD